MILIYRRGKFFFIYLSIYLFNLFIYFSEINQRTEPQGGLDRIYFQVIFIFLQKDDNIEKRSFYIFTVGKTNRTLAIVEWRTDYLLLSLFKQRSHSKIKLTLYVRSLRYVEIVIISTGDKDELLFFFVKMYIFLDIQSFRDFL